MVEGLAKFSQTLLRMVEALAQPHDRTSIAQVRNSFSAVLLESMPKECQSIAFLWLVDECNDEHVATLWAIKSSFDDKIELQIKEPCRLYLYDVRWKGATDLLDQKKILQQFFISIKNDELRRQLEGVCSRVNLDLFKSEFLLPLYPGQIVSGAEPIGFLHLVSSCEAIFPDFTISEIETLAQLLSKTTAVRVTSGRRQRISYAITKFNEELATSNTTKLLGKAAAKVLLGQARAISCAIYRRDNDRGLKLWIDANSDFPSPTLLGTGSMSYAIFCAARGPACRLLSLRSEHLASQFHGITPLADELPAQLNSKSTSWLSYVVRSPNFQNEKPPVPLFLIRLLAISQPSHIGGSFNTTDQEILIQVGDYLTALFPDALLREAIQQVSASSGEIQHKIRERLAKNNFLGREREFAKLIKTTVPAIRDIQIAQRKQQNGVGKTAYWDAEGGPVSPTLAFDWQAQSIERALDNSSVLARPTVRNNTIDIPIYSIDQRAIGFRCCLNYGQLTAHEWNTVEYIVAELRFAALGSLDTHEKTYQIAEIRHALNAGLTGLLGHLKSTNDIYSDCMLAIREGDTQVAHRRVFEEAQFRKSLERARISGEQISAFFEDTRILLADITKDTLQRTLVDIGTIVTELSTLFLRETTRRKIQITTRDISGRTLVNYDKTLLKLALFNLIDNAVKYSFAENIVSISMSTDTPRSQFSITVQNIGPHIPPEIRTQIFEPFRRMRHAGIQAMPGTGLGLAASKKIAHVHGGDIKVESVPVETRQNVVIRARTTFSLIIPREQSAQ
jgi:signal transduction histidine kinase